ncbi:hypothetical protein HU200_027490 [Digitaria exilis]|uniref:Aldose 1-epimerase n=1 Tax=Digitaria exilis TaxID=1010633 RepID=A0A835BUB2_9POAL|nr:hypothetical protein HU200_027490 [Digitaria exilis]
MDRDALLPVVLLLCLALACGADATRKTVGVYELKNKKGDFSIKVTNWGATLIVIWTVKEYVPGGDCPYITLYYHSFDGEQDVYVTYQLSSPYQLSARMNATALNKATPVNLANHAYWNLGGHGSGDVLGQVIQLLASRYTPVDGSMIPTGEVAPVSGTPYDLRAPTPLGSRIRLVSGAGMAGFDINYAVDGDGFREVAYLRDPVSGRAMELWANQPGVQLYTSNWMSNLKGKGGVVYGQYGAVCLETQGFPDAVHHPNFPSVILRPGGAAYRHDMLFKFSQRSGGPARAEIPAGRPASPPMRAQWLMYLGASHLAQCVRFALLCGGVSSRVTRLTVLCATPATDATLRLVRLRTRLPCPRSLTPPAGGDTHDRRPRTPWATKRYPNRFSFPFFRALHPSDPLLLDHDQSCGSLGSYDHTPRTRLRWATAVIITRRTSPHEYSPPVVHVAAPKRRLSLRCGQRDKRNARARDKRCRRAVPRPGLPRRADNSIGHWDLGAGTDEDRRLPFYAPGALGTAWHQLLAMAMTRAPLLLALLGVAALAGGANAAGRKMVGVYELSKGDFSIKVTNWGATLTSVVLPDSKGESRAPAQRPFFLALCFFLPRIHGVRACVAAASCCLRLLLRFGFLPNRVANARFVLDGKAYHLYANDGKNALHGFPGALDVYVTYRLSSPYELSIHMNATALDKATPVNLVNHAYWNLAGQGRGDILGDTVQIFASRYTPVDATLIPTGAVVPVAGTPYDFRRPTPVGARIRDVYAGKAGVYGYDTNFAVDGDAGAMRRVAVVRASGASGRGMELWANQPGVQFYTSNFLDGVKGKGGSVYGQYAALCLETQGFPDAVNHPNFPSQIVRPGGVYRHDMVFKFSF